MFSLYFSNIPCAHQHNSSDCKDPLQHLWTSRTSPMPWSCVVTASSLD